MHYMSHCCIVVHANVNQQQNIFFNDNVNKKEAGFDAADI